MLQAWSEQTPAGSSPISPPGSAPWVVGSLQSHWESGRKQQVPTSQSGYVVEVLTEIIPEALLKYFRVLGQEEDTAFSD